MTQGEMIHAIRLYNHTIADLDERATQCETKVMELERKMEKMDEILKSPVRREVYAAKHTKAEEPVP